MRELFVPLEICVFRMGSGEQSQVRSQGRDDKLVMKLLQKSLSSFRALWAGLWSPRGSVLGEPFGQASAAGLGFVHLPWGFAGRVGFIGNNNPQRASSL